MGLDEDFQTAQDLVSNKINKTLSNDELLEIYALFKQASVGDCNTSRPGMMDFKVGSRSVVERGMTDSKRSSGAKKLAMGDSKVDCRPGIRAPGRSHRLRGYGSSWSRTAQCPSEGGGTRSPAPRC